MKEAGLQDYLVLLSLCQTCRYRGVSFLKFLRSGQQDLDRFCQTRQRRRFSDVQVYPKGFIPPHYSRLLIARGEFNRQRRRTYLNGAGGEEVYNTV